MTLETINTLENLDTLTPADMEAIAIQLNAIEPGTGDVMSNSYFWSDFMAILESMMVLDMIAIGSVLFVSSIIILNLFPNLKKFKLSDLKNRLKI